MRIVGAPISLIYQNSKASCQEIKLNTKEKDTAFHKVLKATKNLQYEIALEDKVAWKGSWCELQYQFKEFIIWIEMFSLEDVKNCHRILVNICEKYVDSFGQVSVCTWIYARYNEDIFRVYSFDNVHELLSGTTAFGNIDDIHATIDMEAALFKKFD